MAAATLVGLWRVEGLHRFALFGERALPPFLIETVGTLIMFEGTEGNVAGAMR